MDYTNITLLGKDFYVYIIKPKIKAFKKQKNYKDINQ